MSKRLMIFCYLHNRDRDNAYESLGTRRLPVGDDTVVFDQEFFSPIS